MLWALCLSLPLATSSEVSLAETALFIAIVGFAWPTRVGRQCRKTGFPAGTNHKLILFTVATHRRNSSFIRKAKFALSKILHRDLFKFGVLDGLILLL